MWGKPRVIPVMMGESFNALPLAKDSATGGGQEKGGEEPEAHNAKAEGEDLPTRRSWRLRRRTKLADEDKEAGGPRGPKGRDCHRTSSTDDQGIVEGGEDRVGFEDRTEGGGVHEAPGQGERKRGWRFGDMRLRNKKVSTAGGGDGAEGAEGGKEAACEVVKEVSEVHVAGGEDGGSADGGGKGVFGRFRSRRRQRKVSVSAGEPAEGGLAGHVVVGREAHEGKDEGEGEGESERGEDDGSFGSSCLSKNATMPEHPDQNSTEEPPARKKGIMSAVRKSVRRRLGIKLKKDREAERLQREASGGLGGEPVVSSTCSVAVVASDDVSC